MLVTVYVLAYNRPDYLFKCLQSIANQTFKNFLVVVLDNASDKELFPIVSMFDMLSIKYVKHSKNIQSFGNFSYAWNEKKNTPYYVIFHDDDLMHPEFLEKSLHAICHLNSPAFSCSESIKFTNQEPVIPKLEKGKILYLNLHELTIGLINDRFDITFSTVMYRSDINSIINLEELINKYSIIFDRPLLLALAGKTNGCAVISQPLAFYRCHPEQDSKNGPINEDNILSLCTAYRNSLLPMISNRVNRDFYTWSSFHLLDSYSRIASQKKSSLPVFLEKAISLNIYRNNFLKKRLNFNWLIFFARLNLRLTFIKKTYK
jgi:glycosyltransferase involved in cell wall biosynthesis